MVPGRLSPLPEESQPMSVIVKRVGEAVEVVNLQMPSFLRGAEDEDAEELFHL